jgi:hypothetical protein
MNDPVFRNVRFLFGTIHAGFPSPARDYEEKDGKPELYSH